MLAVRVDFALTRNALGETWTLTMAIHGADVVHAEMSAYDVANLIGQRAVTNVEFRTVDKSDGAA